MSQTDFFLARATDARRDADTATLANVRERCLRAEAAWLAMAARAERTEKLRAVPKPGPNTDTSELSG